MHIKINHNNCDTRLEFCDHCLAQFLNDPNGAKRPCFEIVDNGTTVLTAERLGSIHNDVIVVDDELLRLTEGVFQPA